MEIKGEEAMAKDKPLFTVSYTVMNNKEVLVHTKFGKKHILQTYKLPEAEKQIKKLEDILQIGGKIGEDISFEL